MSTASITGQEIAPDVAGTVEAWRIWRVVVRGGRFNLMSVLQPTVWPVGEPLLAECRRARAAFAWLRREQRHEAPAQRCECGIYGTNLEQIRQYVMPAPAGSSTPRVLGRVSLWGTVVECERGFRASHAYPERIYVPEDASSRRRSSCEELVEGLKGYEVDVELLPARCIDAPEALAKLVA